MPRRQLAKAVANLAQTSSRRGGGGHLYQCERVITTSTSPEEPSPEPVRSVMTAPVEPDVGLPLEREPYHIPQIITDQFGTVSVLEEGSEITPGVFKNVDGGRFEDGRYAAFTADIDEFIPEKRRFTDPVRTFAYGTDASFYRLNPKMVVKVHSEEEIQRILPIAAKHEVPVTFRAAGTSLSGQAITDSVLLKLSHTGKNFSSRLKTRRSFAVELRFPPSDPVRKRWLCRRRRHVQRSEW